MEICKTCGGREVFFSLLKHTEEQWEGKSKLRGNGVLYFDTHHPHINIINTHLPECDDPK